MDFLSLPTREQLPEVSFFVVCAAGNVNGDALGHIQPGCFEDKNLGGSAPLFVMKSDILGGYTAVRSQTIIMDTSFGNATQVKNFFADSTNSSNGGLKSFDSDSTIAPIDLPNVRFDNGRAIFNTALIFSQVNQRQYFNPTLLTFDFSGTLGNSIVMDYTSPYLEVYPLVTADGVTNTFTIYLPPLTQTGRVYTIYGREMEDTTNSNSLVSGLTVNSNDAGRYINADSLTGWLLEHNVKRGYAALTPTQYLAQCPTHTTSSPSIFSVTVIAGEIGSSPGWKVISSSITGYRPNPSAFTSCT